MIFQETNLSGVYIITLETFSDNRGWFARSYCKEEFEQIGHHAEWLQMNHSFTYEKGAIRGMHYQVPPFSEIKLVRCISGAVHDVIVDLREGSSTFLKYLAVELSADNKKMIYIPAGFAHGFQCLSGNAELIYHHSAMYSSGNEGGIRYNDPMVGIDWPLEPTTISTRDKEHNLLTKDFTGIKITL